MTIPAIFKIGPALNKTGFFRCATLALTCFAAACGPSDPADEQAETLDETYEEVRAQIAAPEPKVDSLKVFQLTRALEAYSDSFPKRPDAGPKLYRAAFLKLDALGDYMGAQSTFRKVYDRYRADDSLAAKALLRVAQIYHVDRRDPENAKKYYKKFLREYPAHPGAKKAEEGLAFYELDEADLKARIQDSLDQAKKGPMAP